MSCVCQKECIKRGQWKKRYIQIYWDFKKYIDIKIDKTLSKVTKLLPSIIFDHTLFLEIWRDVDIWSYPPKTLISQTFQFFPQLRSWPLCFFPKIDGQVLFCPNPKVVLKSIITETNVYAQLPHWPPSNFHAKAFCPFTCENQYFHHFYGCSFRRTLTPQDGETGVLLLYPDTPTGSGSKYKLYLQISFFRKWKWGVFMGHWDGIFESSSTDP